MPQNSAVQHSRSGAELLLPDCAAPNLVVAFSLPRGGNGLRIGTDREYRPKRGSHRGAHDAGPGVRTGPALVLTSSRGSTSCLIRKEARLSPR